MRVDLVILDSPPTDEELENDYGLSADERAVYRQVRERAEQDGSMEDQRGLERHLKRFAAVGLGTWDRDA